MNEAIAYIALQEVLKSLSDSDFYQFKNGLHYYNGDQEIQKIVKIVQNDKD